MNLQSRNAWRHSRDLTIGADVAGAVRLRANARSSNRGVNCIGGSGFIVHARRSCEPRPWQELSCSRTSHSPVPQRTRHDADGRARYMVIDLFGLTSRRSAATISQKLYQWVFERVKPERDQNNRESRRENWWMFGEPTRKLREQLAGLSRYIATVETAKHRVLRVCSTRQFCPTTCSSTSRWTTRTFSGVLSSRIHVTWALAAGGRLGVGNDPRYNKTVCFETFPFPVPDDRHDSSASATLASNSTPTASGSRRSIPN